MIRIFFFLLYICFPYKTYADAWTEPQNSLFVSESAYFRPGEYTNSALYVGEDNVANFHSSRVKAGNQIYAKYGLTDDYTFFGKLDYTNAQQKISLLYNQENVTMKFNFNVIDGNIGIRKRLAKTDNEVLSTSLAYFPGQYYFGPFGKEYVKDTQAIELRFLHGYSDKINWLNQLLNSPEYYHFNTWQIGYKLYHKVKKVEVNIDLQTGFQVADKWQLIFGLFNTFNGYSIYKTPLNREITDQAIDHTNLNEDEKSNLKSELARALKGETTYRQHQLSFKVAKNINNNKTIEGEIISNVFIGKSFRENTFMINYISLL
jgi:hypothetical protein